MLQRKRILTLSILLIGSISWAQSVLGKWKMVDDQNGKARSIVEIYQVNNVVYGKVLELLNPEKKNAVCKKCEGDRKNEKIEGMVVIEGLVKEGAEYSGGTILNPDSGSFYRCKIWLDKDDPDKLYVRGYLAFFYRTQIWQRIK